MAATSSSLKAILSESSSENYDITTKLNELSRRINKMKVNIHDIIQNKYVDFLPQLIIAQKLSKRVENLKGEMKTVKTEINTEISSQLNKSNNQFQKLSSQREEATLTLSFLEKLLVLNQHLESADEAFRHTKFVEVTGNLLTLQKILSKPVHVREEEIKILNAIQTEIKIQNERLIPELNETWKRHIVWDVHDINSAEGKINKLKIIIPPKNDKILQETVQAMWKIDILDPWLVKFGNNLLNYFIKPIITNPTRLLEQSEGTCLALAIDPPNEESQTSPEDVLSQIAIIMKKLNENLFSVPLTSSNDGTQPAISLMERFGCLNSQEICRVIVQDCLLHAIPCNNKDLEKFNDVIAVVNSFQNQMSDMSFIDEKITSLKDFMENVNVLFANKKCQEILEAAHKLMTSEIHQTLVISNDKPLGELPSLDSEAPATKKAKKIEILANETHLSDNTFRLPTCHISESVVKLITLSYETLTEAVSSSAPCAIKMFYAVRNMFEIFCCVFPTYHKQRLTTLPQLTAIHYNNCMYIAHHLMLLGPQFNRMLPPPLCEGAGTFMDLIQKIRSIGTGDLLQQMATQRKDILECLSSAAGFVSISDERNRFSAERSIKQVVYKLNHLKTVWEDILPPNIYFKAMGALINCVLVEMISSIINLVDISAEEASHLHQLLCLLNEKAEPLFCTKHNDDSSNNAHVKIQLQRNIPSWIKFKELIFVLNANLQEISDRWADGKGVLAHEFSSNEMKLLIQALFQNTDRRAAVLARL
ncbi:kinetochore zw10 homolog [Octopus vulgaris]|uniref:Kinetochore zw10 homolog n=2 Tax=Octopus TaxID=6643 RepID=A0AA36ASI7_OCTVU|nr:centromere/kinetochore protein zw10 homolog [Octopus sinensis]CAI9720883.1 kinetochore zw10 homolog [Octopus vulgaris]